MTSNPVSLKAPRRATTLGHENGSLVRLSGMGVNCTTRSINAHGVTRLQYLLRKKSARQHFAVNYAIYRGWRDSHASGAWRLEMAGSRFGAYRETAFRSNERCT